MRRWIAALVLTGTVAISGGCAATDVPVVGSMTPVPTETPSPLVTAVSTKAPTETPIAIITTTPKAPSVTPVPVSLTPVLDADDHLKTIGNKAEGDSVFRVKLVNNTGKAIRNFRIISTLASYYREESNYVNLLSDGDVFADKEERILYYDTYRDPSNDADEKNYNLRLTFEDGSVYELEVVPFFDMEEGIIHSRNGAPYVTYLSKASSTETDTAEGVLLYAGEGQMAEDLRGETPEEGGSHESEDRPYEDDTYDYEDDDYGGEDGSDRDDYDDYDEE